MICDKSGLRCVALFVLLQTPLVLFHFFSSSEEPNLVDAGIDDMALLPPANRMEANGWKLAAFQQNSKRSKFNLHWPFNWASQVGQDRTIVNIFKGKRNGFFVDLAANDAVFLSNTLVLEQKYGWNGLCIEPNLEYLPGLLRRRCQVVAAAVGRKDDDSVLFALNGVFSGVAGDEFDNKEPARQNVEMTTVTIEKIFEDFNVPSVIDYLSLDIEGAELWAFERFPWDKYTFLTITVERPKGLEEILKKNGYTYLMDHGTFGDQLWIHSSLPDFEEVVAKYATQAEAGGNFDPGMAARATKRETEAPPLKPGTRSPAPAV